MSTKKSDAYTRVTDHVIQLLEKGVIPWKLSWADKGLPINLYSGKPYRSINLWLLNAVGYHDNFFLTAQQVQKVGGSVRADEQPNLAVYWHWSDAKHDDLKFETPEKPTATLKCYYLFNISQCKGIPDEIIPFRVPHKQNPIDRCEAVMNEMPNPPALRIQGCESHYQPVYDMITMFEPEKFPSFEYYYATLFNRMILSTGHRNRLNRKAYQGDEMKELLPFTLEALTAEIGASYLCSNCGIDPWNFENRIEYAQGWIERFKKDSRCMVYAALQALRAVDYILGDRHWNVEERQFEHEPGQMEVYEE